MSYVSVYVRNGKEGSACYYRITQYVKDLPEYEFRICNAVTPEEYRKNLDASNGLCKKMYQCFLYIRMVFRRRKDLLYDISHHPSCIIVSREFVPRHLPTCIEKLIMKAANHIPLIWDIDDIPYGEVTKKEVEILQKNCCRIVVTHDFLKKTLSKGTTGQIIILPTTDGFCTREMYSKSLAGRIEDLRRQIRIVWVGSSSNLRNLDLAVDGLEEAAEDLSKIKQVETVLQIVCNRPYIPKALCRFLRIENHTWTRESAEQILLQSHIGIMPLENSRFNTGKGAFKLIQYLSSGTPVIASPVGYNTEVVKTGYGMLADSTSEWKNAVQMLCGHEKWIDRSYDARTAYEEKFSYEQNLGKWREIIGSYVRKA